MRKDRPYIGVQRQRGGAPRYYFRRRGKWTRLADDPDCIEFDTAYWSARQGVKRVPSKGRTLAKLIDSYLASSRY